MQKSIGQAVVEEFIEVRLNEKSVLFWNKVKKMNLYTFQSGNKKLKMNKKSEPTIILKSSINCYFHSCSQLETCVSWILKRICHMNYPLFLHNVHLHSFLLGGELNLLLNF